MTEKQTFKNNRRPDLTSGELDPGSLSLLSWGDETLQCRDFSLPLPSEVPPVQHMRRYNQHMKIPLQLNTMYRWPPWWPPCQTSSFWTPLIHSLRHTELLNCVKLYSMYESCYLHKLYNLGLHPWSANGTAEVFIILRLKTAGDTEQASSSTPRWQPQSWNDFYMFLFCFLIVFEFLASSLLSLLSFLRVSKKMRMIFLTSLQPRSDYPPSVFWSQRSGPSPPH